MKTHLAFLFSLAAAVLFAAPDKALLQAVFTRGALSIPRTDRAPVIDGKVGSDWQTCTTVNGFATDKKLLISGCEGFVRLCRDDKYLYAGIVTSTPSTAPGGSLQTHVMKRDGEVYKDDCVEIYLRNGNTVYILIANAAGTIFDIKRAGSLKNAAWNFKNLKTGTQVENGWWHLEFAIPLAEIGNPQKMKFNVIRRWSKAGAGSLNHTPAALNDKYMFSVDLSGRSPAVQEISYGDPLQGDWDFSAAAVNPLSVPLDFEVLLHHHGKGIVTEGNSRCTIAPGKTGKLHFKAKISGGRIRVLTILLRDKKSGKIYHSRRLMVQRGAALGRRPVTGTLIVENTGSGQIYLLPGYKKAVIEFRPARGKAFKAVSAKIADGQMQDFTFSQNVWKGVLPIPEKAGKYPVDMTFTLPGNKKQNAKNVYSLAIRHFKWENNNIGREKIILPPFIPLTATGSSIKNLTNERKINALGLYDSLLVENNELLAAPMTFKLEVNGRKETFKARSISLRRDQNGYSAASRTRAAGASGITLENTGYFEYDGFHWNTLTLRAGRPVKLNKLTLVIPFKDTAVPLFHAVANELRTNPAGYLPGGNGLLWGGSKLPRKKHAGEEVLHPQMVPYLWLGAEYRGLSFFMDSTFGCKLSRTQDAVRISRKGKTVTVEVDLINRPVDLTGKRTIEFGFHPTPVKYVDHELNKVYYDTEGKHLPGAYRAQFFLPDRTVNFSNKWSKYPFNKDYTFVREFTDILTNGKKIDQQAYVAKLNAQLPAITRQLAPFTGGKETAAKRPAQAQSFVKLYTSSKYRGKTLPFAYFDHRLEFLGDPETDYYKSEWWNPAVQSYFAALRTTQTPSNLDYMVYYMEKMVEAGLHGINLDDAYLMPDTNPDTMARIDAEGELHSRVGIRALRELINRLAVVLHKHRKYPMILNVHMTDALLVPCFAKVTLQTGFELKYGETPHQERFTPDYIRTVGLGTKIGANSNILRGIRRKTTPPAQWKKKEQALNRTVWGVMLPFGIRHAHSQNDTLYLFNRRLVAFGIGEKDCVFMPCWKQKEISAQNMLVSYYKRPGKVLVIVSNYSSKSPQRISLSVDFKALGLTKKVKAADFETRKPVDLENIEVKGYDIRLIQLITK